MFHAAVLRWLFDDYHHFRVHARVSSYPAASYTVLDDCTPLWCESCVQSRHCGNNNWTTIHLELAVRKLLPSQRTKQGKQKEDLHIIDNSDVVRKEWVAKKASNISIPNNIPLPSRPYRLIQNAKWYNPSASFFGFWMFLPTRCTIPIEKAPLSYGLKRIPTLGAAACIS